MDRRMLLRAMSAAAIVPLAGVYKAEAKDAPGDTVYELRIYHAN